jgi:hypothetical protein
MKDRKTTYSVSNDALFCQQKTTENKQYDNWGIAGCDEGL